MLAVVGAALLLAASGAIGCQSTQIERVEARLFYNHSGTLSAPVTATTELWNVIIGEGDADEPSASTLVDVVLSGEPGDYPADARLDVVVTETKSGRIVLKQTSGLGVFSSEGRYHVPVWLAGTGCEPLTVKASLRGTSYRAVLEIPFACGE